MRDREHYLGGSLRALRPWLPAWLDVLAPPRGLPNTAHVDKIDRLWARFDQKGSADLAAFASRPGSPAGFVEGQIGPIWVGIAPDGQAHS